MKNLAYFMGMLKFEDINQNGIANKVINKARTAFKNELFSKNKENLNFERAQK